MKRVLVTGAGGFAGTWLCGILASRGDQVVGLHRREPPASQSEILHRKADIRDRETLRGIVGTLKPDEVYHLAGLTSITDCESHPETAWSVNVEGTRNLLDSLEDLSPDSRVLIASSCHVYGLPKYLPLDEEHPIEPDSLYARSKAAVENLAHTANLQVVIARAFHHTGPGHDSRFALGNWARQIAGGAREVRTGRLDLLRDYSDVRDVVAGYMLLCARGAPGTAYNLCSGISRPLGSILDLLIGTRQISIILDASRLRGGEPLEIRGDASRASLLGWRSAIPLEKSLADLMAETALNR